MKDEEWIDSVKLEPYYFNMLGSRLKLRLISKYLFTTWDKLKITESWRLIKEHFERNGVVAEYNIIPSFNTIPPSSHASFFLSCKPEISEFIIVFREFINEDELKDD